MRIPGGDPAVRRLQGIAAHLLGPGLCSSAAAGAFVQSARPPVRASALGGVRAEEDGFEVDHAKEEAELKRYFEEAEARALALGNRGPIRFDEDGRLAKDILDAYWEHGTYVLEGMISESELREIRGEFEALLENAPSKPGSSTDSRGRPVLKNPAIYNFNEPLSDPWGGSMMGVPDFNGGATKPRHHILMRIPPPPAGVGALPEMVFSGINRPTSNMDSVLRFYGNPKMLAVAETINGPDFTPFQENILYKPARLGWSTAWHQDPSSAWDEEWSKPGFDYGTCGFSFHLSLYDCTPENAMWAVPGTHRSGRIDIKARSVESGGTDRLRGALPILCKPGDVYIHNRMALHGAFANTGPVPRATLIIGFHRRASVVGKSVGGAFGPGKTRTYDEAYIDERSRMIQFAIDARRQKFPDEKPYSYLPYRGREDECRWSELLKQDPAFMNYNRKDIII